jgi:hypothetical protein
MADQDHVSSRFSGDDVAPIPDTRALWLAVVLVSKAQGHLFVCDADLPVWAHCVRTLDNDQCILPSVRTERRQELSRERRTIPKFEQVGPSTIYSARSNSPMSAGFSSSSSRMLGTMMEGGCTSGNGDVLGLESLLRSMMSVSRQTFLPSNLTSNE